MYDAPAARAPIPSRTLAALKCSGLPLRMRPIAASFRLRSRGLIHRGSSVQFWRV